jgi:hypothetical protein
MMMKGKRDSIYSTEDEGEKALFFCFYELKKMIVEPYILASGGSPPSVPLKTISWKEFTVKQNKIRKFQ